MPKHCPDMTEKDFPPGYHIKTWPRGLEVLSGPTGIVAVFIAPEKPGKPVRVAVRTPDDCPKAPAGYRMVHALVKENP